MRIRSYGLFSLCSLFKSLHIPFVKHFTKLALTAEHKSKVVRVLSKCPTPINKSKLEEEAFENFVQGTAILNKMPSPRVIHHQMKKLGYAKTLVRQVEREIGNDVFFNMASKGIVKHTKRLQACSCNEQDSISE